jgi:cell division septum initiation protein DivIVA
MSEKSSFLNWVGFKGEESNAPSSVDRIRELEAQLADLRSRRDITALSKEEFEILATETAMTIIKSAQLREAKAQATADRVMTETTRVAKDTVESADQKAKSLLSSAESRGRKYLQAAETDAQEVLQKAEIEADSLLENKKREATLLTTSARREGERIISEAAHDITEYRQWLAGVITEAERLYKVQSQSLDAAESAIQQSRSRLDSAFVRLAELQKNVLSSLNADDTVIKLEPVTVVSERAKPALDAPGKTSAAAKKSTKKVAKKSTAKRK